MGKFFFTLTAALAEMERGLIGERVSMSLARKKERGEVYGEVPYGFMAVEGNLVPNPEEQELLNRIRELRSDGMSYQAIAERLNTDGILTKKGGQWEIEYACSKLCRTRHKRSLRKRFFGGNGGGIK